MSKIKIQIKSIWGSILYESEKETIKEAVNDANLRGANLRGANLRGANLRGADLYDADLRGANLYGANLYDANLRGANLYGANLRDANLRGANLRGANLYGANLYDADLRGADLYGANLYDANLRGAKNADWATAQTVIVPEGSIIGWKMARLEDSTKVIVKIQIPEEAKRSNASGRKCRAERAEVLAVYPKGKKKAMAKSTEVHSDYDSSYIYKVGNTLEPANGFDEDRWNECAAGIHFFITREEAENY